MTTAEGIVTGYFERPACRPLRPYVEALWWYRGDEACTVLPDGCADLIFSEGRGRLVGPMTTPVQVPAVAQASVVGVRFRPGGAAPFFGPVLQELADTSMELGRFGASSALQKDLEAQCVGAGMLLELERALLQNLSTAQPLDRLVRAASRGMSEEPAVSIEALARRLGRSRQHLARCFKASVGLSPKQLQRIVRMQAVLTHLRESRTDSAAELAQAMGYVDQPHMSRELRALTGNTFSQLLSSGSKNTIAA